MFTLTTVGLFVMLAGFVVGLGAVTVIDVLGYLGRHSPYWTEATIRAHKVTKPLIWAGVLFASLGGAIYYPHVGASIVTYIHLVSLPIMLINGLVLSLHVSPYLLEQERLGRSRELLPPELQRTVFVCFMVSCILWWGNLAALAYGLTAVL